MLKTQTISFDSCGVADTINIVPPNSSLYSSQIDSLNHNLKVIGLELSKNSDQEKIFDIITYDTAFTVGITLLVFVIGYCIDRFFKAFDVEEDKEKLRVFYKENVISITEKLIPAVVKAYKDFYQNHDLETGIPMSAPKILSGDFERLDKLDFEKLYAAFENKTALGKVMSQLDFISRAINDTEVYHKQVHSENQIQRLAYQTLVNDYLTLLASYIRYEQIHNPVYRTDSTYILINSSILFFHLEIAGKRALREFYKEVLRPIQKEIVDTRKYDSHEIGKLIANLGKDLSYRYNELKRVSVEIRMQYRYIETEMNNSHNKLKESLRELQ